MAAPGRARRPRRRRLTAAQRRNAAPRHPAAAIVAYRAALARVADRFAASVRTSLSGKLDRFALRERHDATDDDARSALSGVAFDLATASRAAGTAAAATLRHSRSEFRRLKLVVDREPKLDKALAAWKKASVGRVEKILEREKGTIVDLLADSEDRTPDELSDRLEDRFAVTKRKLETAAHDDILTLNGEITRDRQQAAGVTSYVWTTAGEERVRPSHRELDGRTFDWDDPPVTNDAGDTNIPGGDYNCRCVAFPVLPELDQASDDEAA